MFASGVEFTVSVLMQSPHLVSQISFIASALTNGRSLACTGVTEDVLGNVTVFNETATIQVVNGECM